MVQPNPNTIRPIASDHRRRREILINLCCAFWRGSVWRQRRVAADFSFRLQKTAGFGTTAEVGKAVICQAFIRQMPTLIRAHLATQPDSASLESLAVLADRALASENDVEEVKQGVAEIQVRESGKLAGLLEDLSCRLNKLETSTARAAKKKNYGHPHIQLRFVPQTHHSCLHVMHRQNRLYLVIKMITDKVFSKTFSKLAVLTCRRRIHSRIVLLIRSAQLMHLSAIIIKHSVIKQARAETLAHLL